ncbi:Hypothetical predicted protein, partial [Paramuricea clavata]
NRWNVFNSSPVSAYINIPLIVHFFLAVNIPLMFIDFRFSGFRNSEPLLVFFILSHAPFLSRTNSEPLLTFFILSAPFLSPFFALSSPFCECSIERNSARLDFYVNFC